MTTPQPPSSGNWMNVYPPYPYAGYGYGRDRDYTADCSGLQHQLISGDIHSAARENLQSNFAVSRDVNNGVFGLSRDVNTGHGAIVGAIDRAQISTKDSIENHSLHVTDNIASNGRDILVAVERNGAEGRSATERNGADTRMSVERNGGDTRHAVERGVNQVMTSASKDASLILQSVERNAGESRLLTATTDAASRQFQSDWFRDGLQTTERNGNATRELINKCAFETRLDVDKTDRDVLLTSKDGLLEACKNKCALAEQAAANFAAIQLEQHKIKECLTLQLQDAKYEALKSKCELSSQLAECCCELKEQGKDQFGALKSQINEKTCDVLGAFKETETQRLRDSLNKCELESAIARALRNASPHCHH
jgi:hypothetical protein